MDIAFAYEKRKNHVAFVASLLDGEECGNEERDGRLHPQHAHYFHIFFDTWPSRCQGTPK
jgi:hypothetical protein